MINKIEERLKLIETDIDDQPTQHQLDADGCVMTPFVLFLFGSTEKQNQMISCARIRKTLVHEPCTGVKKKTISLPLRRNVTPVLFALTGGTREIFLGKGSFFSGQLSPAPGDFNPRLSSC